MAKQNYIYKAKFGQIASPVVSFMAAIFMFFSLIALLQERAWWEVVVFCSLLLIFSFLLFAITGILISNDNKNYKIYISYFGIKFGKWKPLKDYPDLAILKKIVSNRAHSRANVSAETARNTFYLICLLTPNHREKIVIAKLKSKEEALKEAPIIASKIGANYTDYNPAISRSTRLRR